jgi:hypothetical protein
MVPFDGLERAHAGQDHAAAAAITPQRRLRHGHGDFQVGLQEPLVDADRRSVGGHAKKLKIPLVARFADGDGETGSQNLVAQLTFEFGFVHLA